MNVTEQSRTSTTTVPDVQKFLQTTTSPFNDSEISALADAIKCNLSSTYEEKRLARLDKEVLSRLQYPRLLIACISPHLDKSTYLFEQDEPTVDAFIKLATTYKRNYYPPETFLSLFNDFMQVVHRYKGHPSTKVFRNILPYDQGGKEWLANALANNLNLSKSEAIILQLNNMPSLFKPSKATQIKYTITYQEEFALGSPASLQILSPDNILAKIRYAFGNTTFRATNETAKAQKDLEKPGFQETFTPSDQAHLLQILVHLSSQPNQQLPKRTELKFLEWCKLVKENLGDEIFLLVTNEQSYKSGSVTEAILVMQQLIDISDDIPGVVPLLKKFYVNQLSLAELNQKLAEAKKEIERKKYVEKDLNEVLEAFSGRNENSYVDIPLNKEELDKITEEYRRIVEIQAEVKKCTLNVLVDQIEQIKIRCKTQPITEQDKLTIFAIGREVIRLKYGILPYNTQILAILGLLQYPPHLRGRIARILTSEGKSTIMRLLNFYWACQNQRVGSLSSSRYLSYRDYEESLEFFNTFNIKTSHLCIDDPTAENFEGQIVFSTGTDVEFAIMRNWLGIHDYNADFDIFNWDEVDLMFIDCLQNPARIAIPGRKKLNWVYRPLLDFVKKHKTAIDSFIFTKEPIESEKEKIIKKLRNELENYQGGKFKNVISFFPEIQFETWIDSAYMALYILKKDVDFIIKPLEKIKGKVRDQVVVMDKEHTGSKQEKSRYQNGVHECLEAMYLLTNDSQNENKTDLTIEEESLMPCSMCHAILASRSRLTFGVTGSVGPSIERKELKHIYQIDSIDVPPHKDRNIQVLDPIVVYTKEDYYKVLRKEVREMQTAGRPTLIVSETIRSSEEIAQEIKKENIYVQRLNEKQAEHEDLVIAKAGRNKMVTSATRKGGRGAHISVKHPQGLHVIVTADQENVKNTLNERSLIQVIGRTGRQGHPGTARIILFLKNPYASLPVGIRPSLPSSQDVLKTLKHCVEKQVVKLSEQRKEKFAIESINHKFLLEFVNSIQAWQKAIDEGFLDQVNQFLKAQINEKTDMDFSDPSYRSLQGNDLQVHKIFRYHAQNIRPKDFSWVPFLTSLKYVLFNTIQQDWAEFFYERLDGLYKSAKKAQCSSAMEEFENLYHGQIKALYLANKHCWENFLLEPEKDFYRYLALITGIYRSV